MENRIILSDEAESVLKEIVDHEETSDYWKNRFENLSNRDDTILRGCFKELRESGLIHVQWGDNYPYHIQIIYKFLKMVICMRKRKRKKEV